MNSALINAVVPTEDAKVFIDWLYSRVKQDIKTAKKGLHPSKQPSYWEGRLSVLNEQLIWLEEFRNK